MKTIFMLLLIITGSLHSQQLSDFDFNPPLIDPVYSLGEGSSIYIDEAHNNFHTLEGRYKPFADLLRKDGYIVRPLNDSVKVHTLDSVNILVIANALNIRNAEDWTLPTPSAFSDDEIKNIVRWVDEGGSLFLIADHMPFPGAVSNLASFFGFKLNNGFAFDSSNGGGPDLFTLKDGTLKNNFITAGRNELEQVDSVYSFTGEAFQLPGDAAPVLVLNKNFVSLMPDTAWNFRKDTPKIPVSGWSQGAVKKFGYGKIAVWGEAAMFSAQITGEKKHKIGMNSPDAKYNYQLLLNLIHWLDNLEE